MVSITKSADAPEKSDEKKKKKKKNVNASTSFMMNEKLFPLYFPDVRLLL